MSITTNLGLTVWDQDTDPYDHIQLATNFTTIDAHDHTSGRGKRIITASLQDQAVTTAKLANSNVTTAKYAIGSITNSKLADDSIDPRVLAPSSVGTEAIADRSVTSLKLAEPIRPLGEVISWWRPSSALPTPDDWEIADGRTLDPSEHDFPGGGNLALPDLRNKFILGASTTGTGPGPTTPPVIGQNGGTHRPDLAHNHSVPHSHSGGSHTHSVNSHNHTVDAHTHGLNAHSHTVNSHSHTVGGHTHPVGAHNHTMIHLHYANAHSHGINAEPPHAHGFAGGHIVSSRRSYIYPSYVGGSEDRQTLYLGGYNSGGTSAPAYMDGSPWHAHGGGTAFAGAYTGHPDNSSTSYSGSTATSNGNFNTSSVSPGTDSSAGSTQASNPATSSAITTTAASESQTSIDSIESESGLTTQDIRPAYIGLLQLIKVKY